MIQANETLKFDLNWIKAAIKMNLARLLHWMWNIMSIKKKKKNSRVPLRVDEKTEESDETLLSVTISFCRASK